MKKLLYLFLVLTFACCIGADFGGFSLNEMDICFNIIQYHESNICDDSSIEIVVSDSDLDRIKFELSESEIGECVTAHIGKPGNPNTFSAWFFNDTNKSWLINDCP